jgi:tRNA nucleotidyltransferase (CCA-adding enzyme)
VEFLLPFDIALLPPDTYIVGGAVRDALLGRERPVPDLDLIVAGDAVALASQIATQQKAGFVLLDAERAIARIVFPGSTVDIAQQMGGSLLADLQRRDYCMNAIACHLVTGEIFDPLGGRQDLADKLVRMISAANLLDDPLRLLRGYRQAAQLGFELEAATADTIGNLAPHLQQAAGERIFTELRYLLSSQNPAMLVAAVEILASWWPGVAHPELLAELQSVIEAFTWTAQNHPALWQELQQPCRSTISTTGTDIALLSTILQGQDSTALLLKLAASRSEIEGVAKVIKYCNYPVPIQTARPNSQEELENNYNLFQRCGKTFPMFVILKIAKSFSLTTTAQSASKKAIGHLIERYLDPQDPLAHPVPLLNGTELMQKLELSPSPVVGRLLQMIQLARVRGEVITKQEAVIFAKKQLDGRESPNLVR